MDPKSMVNYVYYFFSCRHCADNFRRKVNIMGFLPSNPRDSILWLWQIHNMANVKLKGKLKPLKKGTYIPLQGLT